MSSTRIGGPKVAATALDLSEVEAAFFDDAVVREALHDVEVEVELGLTDTEAAFFESQPGRGVRFELPDAPPLSQRAQDLLGGPVRGYGARFARLVQTNCNAEFSKGNRVQPLFDGVESFAARKALILGAKESINLQTFIFNDDATGKELAELLCMKARQGVKVRVLYDALGSNRASNALFDMMREAGVEVREYGPMLQLNRLNYRLHEKYLVVDGCVAIQGGMNIADEYAYGGTKRWVTSRGGDPSRPWRDCDVLLAGHEVLDIQRRFLRNWASIGPDVPLAEEPRLYRTLPVFDDGVDALFISNHPFGDQTNYIEETYHLAICAAQKSIHIETAYFVPTPAIVDALCEKARAGLDVSIMTNSLQTNDIVGSNHVSRYFYAKLLEAGVKIYESQEATLHSKTATFDDELSMIGSANMNSRSKSWDSEDMLVVRDVKTARALRKRFLDGLRERSLKDHKTRTFRRITLREVLDTPMPMRVAQWFFSRFRAFY